MTAPHIAALFLAVPLLAAAEPWFAAECDHTLEVRCAGRSLAAESAGRLPFLDLPAGAAVAVAVAVAVRRVAYDQKGAAVWRIPGGLPATGTMALAFRPDAGASGERPLLRLAGIDLVLDGAGHPLVRAGRGGLVQAGVHPACPRRPRRGDHRLRGHRALLGAVGGGVGAHGLRAAGLQPDPDGRRRTDDRARSQDR